MITYCTVYSVQGYQHSSYDEDNVTKEEHVNIKEQRTEQEQEQSLEGHLE